MNPGMSLSAWIEGIGLIAPGLPSGLRCQPFSCGVSTSNRFTTLSMMLRMTVFFHHHRWSSDFLN